MYEVILTTKGKNAASWLNSARSEDITGKMYSVDEYAVVLDPAEGWTITNDVLLLVGGYLGGPSVVASNDSYEAQAEAVSAAARERLKADPIIVLEAFRHLVYEGHIECKPVSLLDVLLEFKPVFVVLSHDTRIALLVALAMRPVGMKFGELVAVAQRPVPTTYYHLSELILAGLVRSEDPAGKSRGATYYADFSTLGAVMSRLTVLLDSVE